MGQCNCCLTFGSKVLIGDADVGPYTLSVSVDTTRDIIWEPMSEGECEPSSSHRLYMYGPGKSTLQVTAYPFSNTDLEFNLGFTCPIDVSVQIPWKYIFDCRTCVDCLSPETGQVGGKVRGRWVGIPMNKRVVTVTGEQDSTIFEFGGCVTKAAKFSLQAGPQVAITPQPTAQYTDLIYKGLPIPFNTAEAAKIWRLTVRTSNQCNYAAGFTDVPAYLTGFTFNYAPPEPPRVTYNFDAIVTYCPEC